MKKKNPLIAFVLMFIIVISSTSIYLIYANDITVENPSATNIQLQVNNPIITVDGQKKAIDENGTTPIVQNGRTMLPIRAVVEAMGGNVIWDNSSQTATLTYSDNEIKLTVGNTIAYLNGEAQILDVSPTIINERTLLPIRFIAESFGFEVDWEDTNSTVTIKKEATQNPDININQLINENTEIKDVSTETATDKTDKKILIAYFTMPESNGVDAVARASRVIVDDELLGNTQYIANIIEKFTDGDLFEVKAVQAYPSDHDELVDFANVEKNKGLRPELSTQIDNLADYDVIFLGYPIWYADLPMPMYTFLEKYDLSGKTVIPFSTHGGSGFSDTIRTVTNLQPNANVITTGFTVSRDSAFRSESNVKSWVNSLKLAD